MIKLDKKDKLILQSLYKNGRNNNSQIAKEISLSKEVVNYRIKRLEENKILLNIVPIIDYSKLGFLVYRLQLKFKAMTLKDKEAYLNKFKSLPNISWIVDLEGNWDVILLFYLKDHSDFMKVYEEVMVEYGKIISYKVFTIVKSIRYFTPKYILGNEKELLWTGNSKKTYTLSEIEIKILENLFINGRENLINIANNSNLTLNIVKYNLNKLIKNKIIVGFRPVLNVRKLGFESYRVVIELENFEDEEKLKQILILDANVTSITKSLGKYDLEFEAKFEHTFDLLNLIRKIREEIIIKDFEIIFRNKELLTNKISF